jgi:arylsulfatase A-like enzyme
MKFVLVFLDTLRADHLGCYGYGRDTSPHVDDLAAQGCLFQRSYPTDVPTQPSYTSTFTGQRGIVNGVVSHSRDEWLDEKAPWLPSILEQNSYVTGAVSTLCHMKNYFAKGFNHYMNPIAGRRGLTQTVTADQINSFAIPWVKQHSDEDFFLFVHYWDPHTPYKPPEEYRRVFYDGDEKDPRNDSLAGARKGIAWPFTERLINRMEEGITDMEYIRAQYDGEIRYVDDRLSRFLGAIEEEGILDDTFLIVTSDHGESLGEHSIYFDHASVYEDTVRVPLIVRWAGSRAKTVDSIVQHVDFAPTFLELAGIEKPPEMQGKSLLPVLRGETETHREVAYVNQGLWQAKRALVTESWKYTRCIDEGFWPCPKEELYDLSRDPGEAKELSTECPDVLDSLAIGLRRWEEGILGPRRDPLVAAADRGLTPKRSFWRLVGKGEGDYNDWRKKMGW